MSRSARYFVEPLMSNLCQIGRDLSRCNYMIDIRERSSAALGWVGVVVVLVAINLAVWAVALPDSTVERPRVCPGYAGDTAQLEAEGFRLRSDPACQVLLFDEGKGAVIDDPAVYRRYGLEPPLAFEETPVGERERSLQRERYAIMVATATATFLALFGLIIVVRRRSRSSPFLSEDPARQRQPILRNLLTASIVVGGVLMLGSWVVGVVAEEQFAEEACAAPNSIPCAFADSGIYFWVGVIVGVPLAVVGLVMAGWSGRRGRRMWPPLVLAGIVWASLAVFWLYGT